MREPAWRIGAYMIEHVRVNRVRNAGIAAIVEAAARSGRVTTVRIGGEQGLAEGEVLDRAALADILEAHSATSRVAFLEWAPPPPQQCLPFTAHLRSQKQLTGITGCLLV